MNPSNPFYRRLCGISLAFSWVAFSPVIGIGQETPSSDQESALTGVDQDSAQKHRHCSFDEDTAHKPPAGFTETLTAGGGAVKWHVVEALDAPSGKQVVAQLSQDSTNARYPLLVLDDFSAKDVDISVRFKPVSGKVDQAAGIVWRWQDKDNYFIARANALENNVVAYKTVAGKRSSIGIKGDAKAYGVKAEVPSGQWSTLRVRMVGNTAEVYLNDKLMFEVENDSFTSSGKVGLWTKADSVTQFDDLKVMSFDKK
jgi:hypothetical protein